MTFDPQFWDREVNVGDRRMVFVEIGEEHKGADFVGRESDADDVYFSLQLGDPPPKLFDNDGMFDDGMFSARGPVVHVDVLVIYPLPMGPTKFQFEVKVTDVQERVPAIDPYAEVPDGVER